MIRIFTSAAVLLFSSTISLAEVPVPDFTSSEPKKIDGTGVIIEPTQIEIPENKYIFDLGIKNQTDRLLLELKVNKSLSDFDSTNSLSAGISWKF